MEWLSGSLHASRCVFTSVPQFHISHIHVWKCTFIPQHICIFFISKAKSSMRICRLGKCDETQSRERLCVKSLWKFSYEEVGACTSLFGIIKADIAKVVEKILRFSMRRWKVERPSEISNNLKIDYDIFIFLLNAWSFFF